MGSPLGSGQEAGAHIGLEPRGRCWQPDLRAAYAAGEAAAGAALGVHSGETPAAAGETTVAFPDGRCPYRGSYKPRLRARGALKLTAQGADSVIGLRLIASNRRDGWATHAGLPFHESLDHIAEVPKVEVQVTQRCCQHALLGTQGLKSGRPRFAFNLCQLLCQELRVTFGQLVLLGHS